MRRRGAGFGKPNSCEHEIAYSAMEVLDYDIGKCIEKNVVPAKNIALN